MSTSVYLLYGNSEESIFHAIFSSKDLVYSYIRRWIPNFDSDYWIIYELSLNPVTGEGLEDLK